LVKGSTYYYRFLAENKAAADDSPQFDWADSTGSFVAEKVLDFETGTLSINTDNATWSHSSGASGFGEVKQYTWTDPQGNDINYSKAEFIYDRINIGTNLTVNLIGANPLSLQTQDNGSITIGANFVANGGDGKQNRTTQT
jgi:hypothetical protein